MSDLISKEQAIKAMQESEFGFTFEVDVAIEAVKALPTVELEVMGKMSEDLISRKEMIRAVDSLGEDYISYYNLLLLIGNIPSSEPETITIEEVSNQLGCATIQSAFYWFEFLKTLDSLGFAIIRKETK